VPQLGFPPEPAASSVQLPGVALHSSHEPAHALLQHTPSAQKPLEHSSAAPQAWPGVFFGPQLEPVQKFPAEQSAWLAQLVLQAVAPQP
jgi:hypothetical protein